MKKEDESESKSKCLEKFNYLECFSENKAKLKENWALNVKFYEPAGSVEEEEE